MVNFYKKINLNRHLDFMIRMAVDPYLLKKSGMYSELARISMIKFGNKLLMKSMQMATVR